MPASPSVADARDTDVAARTTPADTVAGIPVDTLELSSNIRISVNRLARRLRAEKADGTLTHGQTTVLGLLSVHGAQSLGQLSEREAVTPPSMNRTVEALVTAGYVRRAASAEDRRKVLHVLTPAGVTVVEETRRRRDEWLSPRLARLTEAERRTLADAAALLLGMCER